MKFRDLTEKNHLAKTQLPRPESVLTVDRDLIKGRAFSHLFISNSGLQEVPVSYYRNKCTDRKQSQSLKHKHSVQQKI